MQPSQKEPLTEQDTGEEPVAEPVEKPSRLPWYLQRRFVTSLAFAVIIHLPLTPAGSFFRIATTFIFPEQVPEKKEKTEPQQDLSLPFEMIDMPEDQKKDDSDEGFAPPAAIMGTPPTPKSTTTSKPGEPPKEPEKKAEKKEPEKPKTSKQSSVTARLDTGGDTEEENEQISGDDNAVNGGKKGVLGLKSSDKQHVVGKPDASLVMWFSAWREHQTKTALEGLFACNGLWKPFLRVGLEPLSNLDGIMMTTSDIADGSAATYAVQYNVDKTKVDSAVDALLEKSGTYGKRLAKDAVQLHLWRRYVVAFEHPKNMLFLTPTKGWEELYHHQGPLNLPAARGRALSFTLEDPAPALRIVGAKAPLRLKEVKVDVFANVDGSIDVGVDFEDINEEAAKEDAPILSASLRQVVFDTLQAAKVAGAAFGVSGEEIKAPAISFSASGNHITDTIQIPAAQTTTLMKTLGVFACTTPPKRPLPFATKATSSALYETKKM